MRLWTVHPRYLDAKGLVALWREALLAQKVLEGRTRGYTRHPQLARFQLQARPLDAIASFLGSIADEAETRGYQFDRSRIRHTSDAFQIEETDGQLMYEWKHLCAKLAVRAPNLFSGLRGIKIPEAHPLFRIIPGEVRNWEKAK